MKTFNGVVFVLAVLVGGVAAFFALKPTQAPVPAIVSAPPASAYQLASTNVIHEAMWVAGGPEYQAAVVDLATKYGAVMDQDCRAKFDVAPAVKAYGVYTPPTGPSLLARERMVAKQVATLACTTSFGFGEAAARRLARL